MQRNMMTAAVAVALLILMGLTIVYGAKAAVD
jgi:hypothetical protein